MPCCAEEVEVSHSCSSSGGKECDVCGPQTIPHIVDIDKINRNIESEEIEPSIIDLSDLVGLKPKVIMMNTNCPHINRKHYAKNMCSSCYRKNGRTSYATKCPHKNRILYSKGMC
jgi:hypothetical protein